VLKSAIKDFAPLIFERLEENENGMFLFVMLLARIVGQILSRSRLGCLFEVFPSIVELLLDST
jgi:hypothetical protein